MIKYIQSFKIIFGTCCLLLCSLVSKGQDATFSQFYASPMTLNPALVGNQMYTTVGVNYRHSIISENNVLSQRQVSFLMPLRSSSGGFYDRHIGGVGVSVFNGQSGEDGRFALNSIRVAGAYNLAYGRQGTSMISFGLQGGINQKYYSSKNVRLGSDYNDGNPSFDDSRKIDPVIYPVIDAGIIWNHAVKLNKNFIARAYYLGVAAGNLNLPNEASEANVNDETVPFLVKVHGGYVYNSTSEDWQFSPNFLFQYRDGSRETNVGLYVSYLLAGEETKFRDESHRLTFGAWYKVLNSFIYNIGYENSSLQIGFSYDMNTKFLKYDLGLGSAFEVSARYRFKSKNKKKLFFSPLL